MDRILPIWQPIGYSTYQIAINIARKYGVKVAHTGVLDPLAEGVVILLLGEERFNKQEYAFWNKFYTFEIAFGIKTDSYDGMGLIEKTDFDVNFETEDLKNVLNDLKGEYEQSVPLYSAVKVSGKKLFLYPKQKLESPELPLKKGEIFNIRLEDLYEVSLDDLTDNVLNKLDKVVSGEFRQDEIKNGWQNFKQNVDNGIKIKIAKIEVEISRGMYIRSLSQDICKNLGAVGFVSSLVRTKNGVYCLEDCEKLEEVFGSDFDRNSLSSKYV